MLVLLAHVSAAWYAGADIDDRAMHGAPPSRLVFPPPTVVPSATNYSLPYTVFYNNAGNYYGGNSTSDFDYPPPSPKMFGFVADNFAHTVGTMSFDFSGDPRWPNFIRNGKNFSWSPSCSSGSTTGGAHGVRTETPLGPMCCAAGGCIAQHGNVSAVVELTRAHVLANVPATMAGNCAIDFEGWNSVVFGMQYGSCPSGMPWPLPALLIISAGTESAFLLKRLHDIAST